MKAFKKITLNCILTFGLFITGITNVNAYSKSLDTAKEMDIIFEDGKVLTTTIMLNVEGYNFIKLRDIESSGSKIIYDANKKEIKISTPNGKQWVIINSIVYEGSNTFTLQKPIILKDGYSYLSVRDWATLLETTVSSFESNTIILKHSPSINENYNNFPNVVEKTSTTLDLETDKEFKDLDKMTDEEHRKMWDDFYKDEKNLMNPNTPPMFPKNK